MNNFEKFDAKIAGIEFFFKNVLNISEATRGKKLTQILEKYAGGENTSIYIIMNSKRKEEAAVLSSVNDFLSTQEELKAAKQRIEQLQDEVLALKALSRVGDREVSFAETLQRLDFSAEDVDDIFDNCHEVEID